MSELQIGEVIISKQAEYSENYKKFKDIVNERNIKVVVVDKSNKLKIENDLYFDILWPNNESLILENPLNNNSIVCKLHYNGFSMLFTGDIEEITEKKILQVYVNTNNKDNSNNNNKNTANSITNNNKFCLNSTVLKVGHHGSKTSSTKEFIEAVNPKIALIGVGENNNFGHPNEDVIKRLENMRYPDIQNR